MNPGQPHPLGDPVPGQLNDLVESWGGGTAGARDRIQDPGSINLEREPIRVFDVAHNRERVGLVGDDVDQGLWLKRLMGQCRDDRPLSLHHRFSGDLDLPGERYRDPAIRIDSLVRNIRLLGSKGCARLRWNGALGRKQTSAGIPDRDRHHVAPLQGPDRRRCGIAERFDQRWRLELGELLHDGRGQIDEDKVAVPARIMGDLERCRPLRRLRRASRKKKWSKPAEQGTGPT